MTGMAPVARSLTVTDITIRWDTAGKISPLITHVRPSSFVIQHDCRIVVGNIKYFSPEMISNNSRCRLHSIESSSVCHGGDATHMIAFGDAQNMYGENFAQSS